VGIVVQKYGGSSVADAQGIKRVAQRIVATRKAGHDVCVVVSAMGDSTDELLDLAEQVSPLPPGRELDMLLTAGERISMALLAMAIANLGQTARSFTGSQAGVITDSSHGRAKIIDVTPGRIESALAEGDIAIVAGFQGVSMDTKDITTLGRGGSDTTAVALAAALDAEVCEIYTDVDGIFTADPRIVPTARRIPPTPATPATDARAPPSSPPCARVRAPARPARGQTRHCRPAADRRCAGWPTPRGCPSRSRHRPAHPRRGPPAPPPPSADSDGPAAA